MLNTFFQFYQTHLLCAPAIISDCHYKISIYLFHCKSETVQMHHHSVSICFLLISGLVRSVCIGFGELLCVVGHSEWIFFHKTYSSLHFARFFLFSHLESISQQKGNEKNSEIPWYHMKQKNLSIYLYLSLRILEVLVILTIWASFLLFNNVRIWS